MIFGIQIKDFKKFKCSHCNSKKVSYIASRAYSEDQEVMEQYTCHNCGEVTELYEHGATHHYNKNEI